MVAEPDALFHEPSWQVAGLDTSSALGAFERMEEKVMSLEAQAEAVQMVSCTLVLLSVLLLRNSQGLRRSPL